MISRVELLPRMLRAIGFKKRVLKQFKKPPRRRRTMSSLLFRLKWGWVKGDIDGFRIETFNPGSQKHIILLHGGAYVLQATSFHRKIIEKLVRKWNFAVSFIDYPKAPENNYRKTHEVLHRAYVMLVESFPRNDFYFLGDSAGGGLALGYLQTLRDMRFYKNPVKTVLFSPWVDMTMTNPGIAVYEKRDPVLPLDGLKLAAESYSSGDDLRIPLLSPIFGEMEDLGTLLVYAGTEEIFYPDILLMAEKLGRSSGTECDLRIGQGMVHDWLVVPLPESERSLSEIAGFLLKE